MVLGGALGPLLPARDLTARRSSGRALDDALGHRFADPALLVRALTHRSAGPKGHNERLEFLGDRVLGLVVATHLDGAYPEDAEGELSARYNALVRRETLAEIARAIGIGPALVMAKSEEGIGGRDKPAILADALEAVIAALYLDGGLDVARAFILRHWAPFIEGRAQPPKDSKTALNLLAMARNLGNPAYIETGRSGPDHAPRFRVAARLPDGTEAMGEGPSKRVAEQAAAEALLAKLEGPE
jgi:ribonuclease-3